MQFMRDPVKRCLSIYRHALRTGFANRAMTRTLWRPIDHRRGFSLDCFLRFLEKAGVDGDINVHFRSQVHPVSRFLDVERIDVDACDLFAELNRLESELNLRQTDFPNHRAFQQIMKRHVAPASQGRLADETTLLTHTDARDAWPAFEDQLRPETIARIRRIYASDVAFLERACP